ncbi:hypothetical protein [Microcoleus sp. AT9b-C4]|uniref:hypothetical protein n=1 Tax=Microcoleus sp. AT9b-C4 TaxID=2818630 RepID=UPI002FCFD115
MLVALSLVAVGNIRDRIHPATIVTPLDARVQQHKAETSDRLPTSKSQTFRVLS